MGPPELVGAKMRAGTACREIGDIRTKHLPRPAGAATVRRFGCSCARGRGHDQSEAIQPFILRNHLQTGTSRMNPKFAFSGSASPFFSILGLFFMFLAVAGGFRRPPCVLCSNFLRRRQIYIFSSSNVSVHPRRTLVRRSGGTPCSAFSSESLAIGVANRFVHIDQYEYLSAVGVLIQFIGYLPVGAISHLGFCPRA